MATLLSSRLGKLERAASVNRHIRYDVSRLPVEDDNVIFPDREMTEAEWVMAFKPTDA